MKIDLETAQYYSGLGAIVTLAWLAEGAKGGPDPITFHRTRDLPLLRLLGLAVDPEPGGVCLDPVYKAEVDDGCRLPRLEYIRRFLGMATAPARPDLHITT